MDNGTLIPYIFPPVNWFIEGVIRGKLAVGIGGWYDKTIKPNRYRILSSNGTLSLTVPVVHTGEKKRFSETRVFYENKWPQQHISSLRAAYNNAPFYEFYDYKILPLLDKPDALLIDMATSAIETVSHALCPDIPLSFENVMPGKMAFDESTPEYTQVFEEKFGFTDGMSALDLLFNLGPDAEEYIYKAAQKRKEKEQQKEM